MEHMKGASPGLALYLPATNKLGWSVCHWKNSSLLQKSVNYSRKKFYRIGSRRGEVRNSPQEITEVSIIEAEQVIVSTKQLYLKYGKL